MLLSRASTASPICSKEATYTGHMLIRFWCDSDITFLHGLHKKLVTVLYFSIINVLWLKIYVRRVKMKICPTSFAPQAVIYFSMK